MTKPTTTKAAKSARRLAATALLAALAVLGLSALAVGAATTTRDSNGTATSAGSSARAGKGFTLAGAAVRPVVLGGAGTPIALEVRNPNPQTLVVTDVVATIAATSKPGCAKGDFSVVVPRRSFTVAPRSTLVVPAADRPLVRWGNRNAAQNACLGTGLTFAYTGTGSLR